MGTILTTEYVQAGEHQDAMKELAEKARKKDIIKAAIINKDLTNGIMQREKLKGKQLEKAAKLAANQEKAKLALTKAEKMVLA